MNEQIFHTFLRSTDFQDAELRLSQPKKMMKNKRARTCMYIVYSILYRWWFHFFNFYPYLREMIQFDEHIFEMGWFNQLDKLFMGIPIQ